MQRIIRKLSNIPGDQLTREHVLSATVIRLPFRLCTGSLFRLKDPDRETCSLWFRNRSTVPFGSGPEGVLSSGFFDILRVDPERLMTDAVLLTKPVYFRPGEFEALQSMDVGKIGPASFAIPGLNFLNEAIAAHQMVRLGPYVSGLGAVWPRILTNKEIFARILCEVILIAKPNRALEDKDITDIFEELDQWPATGSQSLSGDIEDYSEEQLVELQKTIEKIRSHAFYELRSNAVAAALNDDMTVAIVLACAALEGAHGAFIHFALKEDFDGSDSDYNKFLDSLLRDQGFYSLVQLSVRKFLAYDQRPNTDDLKACLKGITIRNAIMHAGRRKTGVYKIREYSSEELNNGYSGIMAIYQTFKNAVETYENYT